MLRKLIFRKLRDKCINQHELNYLFWECTLRCNLNCLHCGSDCLKSSETQDMKSEDFVSVLDDIKSKLNPKRLAVCITGGEPLLRNDLEEVGKEIRKRGFVWGIVTNGISFTKERFYSLIDAGMGSMSFSLDGMENQHNYLRQCNVSFSKTIEAIKTVVDFQSSNSRKFIFDVITCVHKGNLGQLPQLKDFLISLGVQNWRIFTIYPQGRAAENNLSLDSKEYRELMEFIKSTRKENSIRLNYSCEGFLGKYEMKVRDFYFFCRAGISIGSVMCDGSISACLSIRGKDFIQGNIYNDSFSDVWNSKFRNMRDRTWAKKEKCRKCRQWKNCMGSGIHLHNNMTDEVMHCNYSLVK